MLDQEYSSEKIEEQSTHKEMLELILSRELSPDSIDDYANSALVDLIDLVKKTVSNFNMPRVIEYDSKRDMEDAAFSYYGLGDIEIVLDYVAEKANEINNLDMIISGAEACRKIIVPPDTAEYIDGDGGKFEKKKITPRLKTLLFILCNDFDVDINDPEQLIIKKGEVSQNMMRREPYFQVVAPKLERTILICDEEKNATFIFDLSLMEEANISSDNVTDLTKSRLNDLISETPMLGSRLKYSNHFVDRLICAIDKPGNTRSESISTEVTHKSNYLYPKAPEGVASLSVFAKKLGVSPMTVSKFLPVLSENIGNLSVYRFGTNHSQGYTTKQQSIIEKYLVDNGILVEKAPDGILSIFGISRDLSMAHHPVQNAIDNLGENIGPTDIYRFGGKRCTGFTPEQQNLIKDYIYGVGGRAEEAPDGYLSIRGISLELEVSQDAVDGAVKKLQNKLGEISIYKFKTKSVRAYDKEQQDQIRNYLDKKGLMSAKQATSEITSTYSLSENLGVSHPTVVKAVNKLKNEIGQIDKYRFNTVIADGFTVEQQDIIRAYIYSNSTMYEQAPSDIESVCSLARKLGTTDYTINTAIRELGGKIGVINTYRYGSVTAKGYTLEQQSKIRQQITDHHPRSNLK